MHTIGPLLFAQAADGRLVSSIGTLFPRHELLITHPPMHALQREAFKSWLAEAHRGGEPTPPTEPKQAWEAAESVDLIFAAGGVVLIRPELERLDLAFEADHQLQSAWAVPRHRIRFLSVRDSRVRQALRERGELWRLGGAPSDQEHLAEAIARSRVAVGEQAIYFYNPHTGTRYVTCAGFGGLSRLEDGALARQLDEIAGHCTRRNRHGHPEIAFLGADILKFGGPNFVGLRFAELPREALRAQYEALVRQFREAADPDLKADDPQSRSWQSRVYTAITRDGQDAAATDTLQGVSSDFSLRIRWLPGGRFEDGEFIFASVSLKDPETIEDPELKLLWDPLAHGFIANFIREYGNIEFLNLGRIEATPGAAPSPRGRRAVYLAELKVKGELNPRVMFLRVQRWGIRERLEEKDETGKPKDLVRAVFETEEYVDYTLDRRLGCLQFHMQLPPRVNLRRVTEVYRGSRQEFAKHAFPVIYYERDYLPGTPTNKLAERKLADPRYALALARLLGRAAAPNLVVGRTRNALLGTGPGDTLFDDGDEIVVEASDGLPRELVLVDHSGAFADWRTPALVILARGYAAPVNRRADKVPDPKAFAEAYLAAFREEFVRIQTDYERRRGAFDGLFKHLPSGDEGSFACRWEHVLRRLQGTDVEELIREIRKGIAVLK